MGIKRDNADKWFSDVVRAKADWACECCGKEFGGRSSGLHCAHIYGRANKSTRWSLDNAVSLCYGCHRTFTEHPLDFKNWLDGYLGSGHIERLTEKRRAVLKTNKALRDEIASHYKEQYELMAQGNDPVSYN